MTAPNPRLGGSLLVVALFACGRVSPTPTGGGAASSGDDSNDGGDSTSTAAFIDPAPLALQPAVPPDAPCNTPPGQVVKIVSDNAFGTAMDASFAYVGSPLGITQAPLTGGMALVVALPDAGPIPLGPFILGDGALLYATDAHTLGRIRVPRDATAGPITMAITAPFPALATDGLNVWAVDRANPPVVYQMPIDGSKTIVTSTLSATSEIFATAASAEGLYIVVSERGAPNNQLVKVPRGGGDIVTVSSSFGGDPIALDDQFVYSIGNAGNGEEHGVYRMNRDGTGNTLLVDTADAYFLTVDAHAVYFTTASILGRVDKNGGAVTKLADVVAFSPVMVRGGNVYFAVGDSGLAIEPGLYSTCK